MNHLKREIKLTQSEKKQLEEMLHKGKWKSRELRNARLLLLANESELTNEELITECNCSEATVTLVKKRYCEEGLKGALFDKPRTGAPKRLTIEEEAYIIATACTKAPDGYDHWTLELLADHFEKHKKKHIGTATVYRVELRNKIKPWGKKGMGDSKNR